MILIKSLEKILKGLVKNDYIKITLFAIVLYSVSCQKKANNCLNKIEIISREEWGARKWKSHISMYKEYGLEKPNYEWITIHNSNLGRGVEESIIKFIQNYHMEEFGWADIGYNYVIDSAGNIYEGRLLRFVPCHAGQTIEANKRENIL